MKYIRLIICACTLFLIGGSLGLAEEADGFIGTWYLNSIELAGQSLHPSYIHTEETLTIRTDGLVEVWSAFEGHEDAETAEWTLDGGELIADFESGAEVIYMFDGDSLCVESEVMRRIYGREKIEGFVEPVQRPDALREEFEGLWSMTFVTIPGFGTWPWEMLFGEGNAWFAPDEARLLRIDRDSAHWVYTSEGAANLPYSCSMEDGCLLLTNGHDDRYAKLNTDGTLSCHSTETYPDGSEVIWYFERVE